MSFFAPKPLTKMALAALAVCGVTTHANAKTHLPQTITTHATSTSTYIDTTGLDRMSAYVDIVMTYVNYDQQHNTNMYGNLIDQSSVAFLARVTEDYGVGFSRDKIAKIKPEAAIIFNLADNAAARGVKPMVVYVAPQPGQPDNEILGAHPIDLNTAMDQTSAEAPKAADAALGIGSFAVTKDDLAKPAPMALPGIALPSIDMPALPVPPIDVVGDPIPPVASTPIGMASPTEKPAPTPTITTRRTLTAKAPASHHQKISAPTPVPTYSAPHPIEPKPKHTVTPKQPEQPKKSNDNNNDKQPTLADDLLELGAGAGLAGMAALAGADAIGTIEQRRRRTRNFGVMQRIALNGWNSKFEIGFGIAAGLASKSIVAHFGLAAMATTAVGASTIFAPIVAAMAVGAAAGALTGIAKALYFNNVKNKSALNFQRKSLWKAAATGACMGAAGSLLGLGLHGLFEHFGSARHTVSAPTTHATTAPQSTGVPAVTPTLVAPIAHTTTIGGISLDDAQFNKLSANLQQLATSTNAHDQLRVLSEGAEQLVQSNPNDINTLKLAQNMMEQGHRLITSGQVHSIVWNAAYRRDMPGIAALIKNATPAPA